MSHNVATEVKVKRSTRRDSKRVGIPTKDEIRTILDNAPETHRAMFTTAIFTGMRISELRGLTWEAVDFDRKVIRVFQRADEYCEIGLPKSRAGAREIPMAPTVVNTLSDWHGRCPKSELDLVFPNSVGKVQNYSNIYNRVFKPMLVTNGIVDDDGTAKFGIQVDVAAKALKDLGEEVDISALEAELEKIGTAVEKAGSDRDRLQGREASAKAALAEARATHDAAVADIVPELRDRNVLNGKINEARAAGEALRAALQAARDKEKKTREAALSAGKDAEAAAGRLKEQAERKTRAEGAFLERLKANGLDRAQYDRLKPEFERIEADRERVEGHRTKLLEADTRRRDAAGAIRGLEEPNLPPLEETLANAEALVDQAVQAAAAAKAHGERLTQLKNTIEQTYRQLEELEAETGPLRELAQRADGKNDLKLDLETFAIGAMFDRVLEAANLRLSSVPRVGVIPAGSAG
jgi:hypothetical protein